MVVLGTASRSRLIFQERPTRSVPTRRERMIRVDLVRLVLSGFVSNISFATRRLYFVLSKARLDRFRRIRRVYGV